MSDARCRPFIKWAGGKTKLIPVLRELLMQVPHRFQTYFEPFIGGGALFYSLLPRHAYLSDLNPELVNAYLVVRDKVHDLMECLEQYRYSEADFYKIRDVDRSAEFKNWTDVQRAGRFIYLNKTCFNGLYRVNSKGEFNVPFGRYKNPVILDRENLLACSKALEQAKVVCAPFDQVEHEAQEGDVVYFDPPYAPVSRTANFAAYHSEGFTLSDQERLRDLCGRLHAKGVYFLVSNSSTGVILDLYQAFTVRTVNAARSINSRGDRRGKVEEVIVSNSF